MKNRSVTPWEDQFYDPALFDAAAGDAYSDEVEALYFQLIGESPKRIVEFGCGTGRVILKLAARGHAVTGIDISETMLAYLRRKVKDLPADKQDQIRIICADGSDTNDVDKHEVAIAVDDFLTHFLDKNLLISLFRQVAACLEPGSFFITDLRARDPEKLRLAEKEYPKNVYTYGIVNDVQVDKEVFSASMKYWEDYDISSNVLCSHQIFDFIRKDGGVEKTVYKTLRQKLLTRQDLTTIASAAQFELHRFLPFNPNKGKDENAGIYIFQLKD
jgi:SAM-dependent methyltransferase